MGVIGCASGTGVNPRGGDTSIDSGRDAGTPPIDTGATVDDAAAPDGSTGCVAMSTRPCSSSCATGTQTCTAGVWGACNAPTTCNCMPGEPARTIACMNCGSQQQTCQNGTWTNTGVCMRSGPCAPGAMDVGASCGMCGQQARMCQMDCTWGAWACNGGGVCVAGTTDTGMQVCGTCGTGTQTRSRMCDATTCQWGAWTNWSTCVGGGSGMCTPGQTDTQSQPCGNCGSGTQTRTRSCDVAAGCMWGAWGAWGACNGASGCAPGDTRACSPQDDCGHQVCGGNCQWGGCVPRVGGGCLCDNASPGSGCRRFQCCGAGRWQFCNPAACVWNACAAMSVPSC